MRSERWSAAVRAARERAGRLRARAAYAWAGAAAAAGPAARRAWVLARRRPEAVVAAGLLVGVAAMVVHWM